MQGLAIEVFENKLIQKSFRHYFLKIKAKREKILDVIQKTNIRSIVELTTPQGGFYLWGRFKDENKNTNDLLELAKKNLVSYVPGHIYFTKKDIINSFRLAYSQIELHDIGTAIERLKKTFF